MDRNTARRRGIAVGKLLIGLGSTVAVVGLGCWLLVPSAWSTVEEKPLTGKVVVGRFTHEIVERGDIASSSNVEVRCEVQMRTPSTGTAILEIVPEGTFVESGDFLIRLDDSSLQNELTLQQIDCNSSQASVIQALTSVETAKLSLSEYESGTFKQEEEQYQSEIFIAEENFRRAEEYLKYSRRLASKGYVTPIQLEADRFAVDKAQKELDVAETKLKVLREYTKQKMLKQLEAAVRTAEAQLEAARETDSVEQARLEKIKEQIAKCIILAPTAGQVVYANDNTGRGGEDVVLIEEGRMVRERQILVRLPNPKKMQVTAKINEARIDLVRTGMKARVKIDALPDLVLEGRVRRVSEYPLQQYSSYTSHIKEYATEIDILNPPEGLRPGMTAQAAVIVEERSEATQVPLQAVFERAGRYYCLAHSAEGLAAKQVQVGPTNDKFVVVEAGLQGTEEVVMVPQQFVDRVALPTPIDFPARSSRPIVRTDVDDATPPVAAKSESAPRRKASVAATSTDTAAMQGAGL
jgi:multidrug efflux pump subunit AcrA (membrane-fusion protein)